MSKNSPSSTAQTSTALPRSVWLLSWVSFFADVSGEMIYPLLPLYVIGVLGSNKTQLGAMEGAAVLIVALMSAFAGFRSDRKGKGGGRVPWIRWGYGLPVLGKSLIAVAQVWPMVFGGRLLDRFGKGLRGAPRDALIADAVTAEQRGRAFGMHCAFDTAGALLGVLLAAFLLWWLTGSPQKEVASEGLALASQTPPWIYRTIFGVGAALAARIIHPHVSRRRNSLACRTHARIGGRHTSQHSVRDLKHNIQTPFFVVPGSVLGDAAGFDSLLTGQQQ